MDRTSKPLNKPQRLEYCAPELKQWGAVADLTQLGGAGGGGDIGFNRGGRQVGSDNGSVFPGGINFGSNGSGGGRGRRA